MFFSQFTITSATRITSLTQHQVRHRLILQTHEQLVTCSDYANHYEYSIPYSSHCLNLIPHRLLHQYIKSADVESNSSYKSNNYGNLTEPTYNLLPL